MKKKILELLTTLEAIYFLTKALEVNYERIAMIRERLDSLAAEQKKSLLAELQEEIRQTREHYGAIATDDKYRELLRDARARRGYAYLPKLNIDRHLFQHYERVFGRWPHVPLHGVVVFDGQTNQTLRQVFTLEGALFDDLRFFLDRAREARKGIEDFRKRDPKNQKALLAYARAASTTTFHFLEAYLNGLAYDCFRKHHDDLPIEDQDLLAEWNSKKKKRRYVPFETKLFGYPRVVAKTYGILLDVSDLEAAKLLASEGKDIRDALTHPSPYVDPKSGLEEKLFWVTGVGFDGAEQLFNAAKEYVFAVEKGVGKDPHKTMPWFFE